MNDLGQLTEEIIAFRDARNWKVNHNPKDLAIALIGEANEVLEHFHWKSGDKLDAYVALHRAEIGEEMADVLIYLVTMADAMNVDLIEQAYIKLRKNEQRFPVKKA